jgi:hypothetical protein
MESVYLLAPEWDSTYDLDTAGGAENDDVFTTGINYFMHILGINYFLKCDDIRTQPSCHHGLVK